MIPRTTLVGGIIDRVDSDINDDGSGLDPAALDELRSTHGSYDNIRTTYSRLDILRARMGNCYGGIALHKQKCDRDANDVGTANDDGVFTLDGDTRAIQQFNAALRRARRVEINSVEGPCTTSWSMSFGVRQLGYIERVQAINVLVLSDAI